MFCNNEQEILITTMICLLLFFIFRLNHWIWIEIISSNNSTILYNYVTEVYSDVRYVWQIVVGFISYFLGTQRRINKLWLETQRPFHSRVLRGENTTSSVHARIWRQHSISRPQDGVGGTPTKYGWRSAPNCLLPKL